MKTPTIAFNTANLVGRFVGYNRTGHDWGTLQKLTVEKTDAKEFEVICGQIARCGFDAAEWWVAHVDPTTLTDDKSAALRRSMREHGIRPVALAGTLNPANASACLKLGIPLCAGGYWGSDLATVTRVSRETGIRFAYENHPEKTPQEIREKIANGANGLGAAVDTGFFGALNIDGIAFIRELGTLIKHVHLKDVEKLGSHNCVPLGTGCVGIPAIVRELKAIGYSGVISWEDEPENRNPFDVAAEMRVYITKLWNS